MVRSVERKSAKNTNGVAPPVRYPNKRNNFIVLRGCDADVTQSLPLFFAQSGRVDLPATILSPPLL